MPSPPQPDPSLAEIEAAWRGKPPEQPSEPGSRGPPRPASTNLGRSINRALLILMACLYLAGLIALVAQAPAELTPPLGKSDVRLFQEGDNSAAFDRHARDPFTSLKTQDYTVSLRGLVNQS
jgi:hypothetical protein